MENNIDSTGTITFDNCYFDWQPYQPYTPYEPYTPYPTSPWTPWDPSPQTRKVKRTTKTIEKYGPDGEYLGKEVITKEIEDFDRQVYDGTVTIIGTGTGTVTIIGTGTDITWDNNNISGSTTHWDPDDPNVQWSYTSGNPVLGEVFSSN